MKEQYQAPTEYTVERMHPDDAEAVLALHDAVWLATFDNETMNPDPKEVARHRAGATPEKIAEVRAATVEPLETAERVWFVAKDGDKVIGFTRPWRADDDGFQRLGAIYVDPAYHGSGVADKLMQQAIDWSDPTRPLYLWVAARNERAQGFYDRWGFKQVEGENAHKEIYGKVPHIQMARKGDGQ